MQESAMFGQYELVEQVGKGGMATVYKARHPRLDRMVAIKVMHNAFLQDQTFITRFEREARIVASLEHPNIVPIFDYSEHDGKPYLVMKYVDGVTLKQRVLKQGIQPAEVATLMLPIADALDYAHRKGVLHRDMKPSNILIDSDDKPWLTDFGLARMAQVGESTISHDMMLGTPYYISPEQAQGSKNLTSSTDIYSLGVILYELVTGGVPFNADSAYAIVHGHIYQPVEKPTERNPQLPVALDTVLIKALAKLPEDRYPTAIALMQDFTAALGGEPLTTVVKTQTAPKVPPVSAPIPSAVPQKRQTIEADFDFSNIEWRELGRKAQATMTNFASRIEDQIDSELARREGISPDDPADKIRKRIEKRYKRRNEVIGHAITYASVNVGLYLFFILIADIFPWWLLFMTFGWGAGLAADISKYYSEYGPGAARRNAEIAAEIERELGSRSQTKRKNDPVNDLFDDDASVAAPNMRLTDDGEFTDSYIAEQEKKRVRR